MITSLLLAFTTLISIVSFRENNNILPYSLQRPECFDKMKFNAYLVWYKRDYYRLISSGFIHGDWWHLIFNMMTLYFFGYNVENYFITIFDVNLGRFLYALMYFLAIAISSLSDLFKYRNMHYYNAIGASGAVCAVLFAAILFNPKMGIAFFFIPIPIPGFIFGPLFLLFCHYMAKKNADNIGHSAHFWGAIFGFLFPILLYPKIIFHFLNQFF
ncbi:MAG: rhomboid family intramembrane serine protease [Bacteroidales bacterium]|nr:rhomboid family intramembrane serine protease [Bacteroidales bacterium]